MKNNFIELHNSDGPIMINFDNVNKIYQENDHTVITFNCARGEQIHLVWINEDYETIKKMLGV
jgi:20S proteasome alpha/beta subunit